MKLKVGKTYRARNGETFTIIEEVDNATHYRFSGGYHDDGTYLVWLAGGSYLTPLCEYKLDLLEEVKP